MLKRMLFIGVLLVLSSHVGATQRLMVNFELIQDKTIQEQGYVLVSDKLKTWNKGLQTSYLKLQCKQLNSGKTEKQLSTVSLFDGLQVTHQRVEDFIELTVTVNKVKPRFIEIRKLAANECQEMSPIVTKTTETYKVAAKTGLNGSYPFGQFKTFKYSVN